MNLKSLTKSTGKKRGLGALIVMVPMIVKYLLKVSRVDFEVDDDLLNILFGIGAIIWSGGMIHAYLPKVLKVTTVIERSLETFNEWAKKKIAKRKK